MHLVSQYLRSESSIFADYPRLFLSCDEYHTVGVPTIWTTDAVIVSVFQARDPPRRITLYLSLSGLIMYNTRDCMTDVVDVILGVIMITRLHAMYQRSRKVLIFLVVIFLAIRIPNAVMLAIEIMQISGEEFILSGTYQCMIFYAGDALSLYSITWTLGAVWEVLVLCLAVWIAVKHFRELRRHSTSSVLGDCFTVLMRTHVNYFASVLIVSCFQIGLFSPTLSADPNSLDVQIYFGLAQVFQVAQMFMLGPRLILSIREYHAKLVADSDTATVMTSIAFQERVQVSTSSSV
ncbi:hypothetical protein DFJ58DRAFT_148959 [Suillus subalutaceus]|uniref:uncharacterized protein n=1 Tax=Suillus subalutaceus TaxID=48586 RepID=UPI001B87F3A2|nr:uncharacterized protein DFJ58DRAFT_148959 [Suillus subalutaceus]KAG1837282.1 hypothetical protein DFJ58DRAFT_148959 [Suillus subalutaceus]